MVMFMDKKEEGYDDGCFKSWLVEVFPAVSLDDNSRWCLVGYMI